MKKVLIIILIAIIGAAAFFVFRPKNETKEPMLETPAEVQSETPAETIQPRHFYRVEELDSLGKSVMDSIKTGLLVCNSLEEIDSLLYFFHTNERLRDGMNTTTMFMEYFLNNPLTFENRLVKTQSLGYVYTFDALDKSFKIWSYDNGVGGTQRFYENFIQYKDNTGEVCYERFYLFGPEGERSPNLNNPLIYKAYPLQHNGEYYYLLMMEKQFERSELAKHVAIVTFNNGRPSYHTSFFPKGSIAPGEHCMSIEDIRNSAKVSYDPVNYEISCNTEEYHQDSPSTVTTHKVKLNINEVPLTDYGEPFPIDTYKEGVYYKGKPESRISKSSIIGKWCMYGHLYDPRTFLTLNNDGTYHYILEECIGRDKASSEMRYIFREEHCGKYLYLSSQNKITLLNFREKSEIIESDFTKYADPISREMIVYSIEGDSMKVYEDTDIWCYTKTQGN